MTNISSSACSRQSYFQDFLMSQTVLCPTLYMLAITDHSKLDIWSISMTASLNSVISHPIAVEAHAPNKMKSLSTSAIIQTSKDVLYRTCIISFVFNIFLNLIARVLVSVHYAYGTNRLWLRNWTIRYTCLDPICFALDPIRYHMCSQWTVSNKLQSRRS